MSIANSGVFIVCDGGCGARTLLPIGLRSVLRAETGLPPIAAGWLFVSGTAGARHYCPACKAGFLRSYTAAAPLKDEGDESVGGTVGASLEDRR